MSTHIETARRLLSAAAVRERAHQMLALAEAGELAEWAVDLCRLEAAADLTAETVRANYPDLKVPFHARWRMFVAGGAICGPRRTNRPILWSWGGRRSTS